MDYLKYYDLERYLFEDVSKRFRKQGSMSAFDFFSIVVWKANRAKSQIARKLLTVRTRSNSACSEPDSAYLSTDNSPRINQKGSCRVAVEARSLAAFLGRERWNEIHKAAVYRTVDFHYRDR